MKSLGCGNQKRIMSNEVIAATLAKEINDIAKEKDIDPNMVAEFLSFSIKKAYAKKNYEDNLEVVIDPAQGTLDANLLFEVVDKAFADSDEFDDILQISEADPEVKKQGLNPGDFYKKPFNIIKEFSHAQVQQILQSFKQKIVEVTNQKVFNSWKDKVGQVILAELEREDQKRGSLYVNLDFPNMMKTMGFVSLKEQNRLEKLEVGRKYPFVIKEVTEVTKFWPVVLSRADERLIRYYMTLENPEIEEGAIEIVKIARMVGLKTKVVVASKHPTFLEPAAICVGQGGMRVKTVSNAVGGEKVEIYNYSEDPLVMLTNLFGRQRIKAVKFIKNEEDQIVKAVVLADRDMLPMLIGSHGHNIKQNSQLLGFSIEVISEDDLLDEERDFIYVDSPEFEAHFYAKPQNDIGRDRETITDFEEETESLDELQDDYLDDENHELLADEEVSVADDDDETDELDLYDDSFEDEIQNVLKNEKK